MKKNSYVLGIINPSDILKGVRGGSTGFISSILPHLKAQQIKIFGIGLNGSDIWATNYIALNISFTPICDIKYPSKIPLRLTSLIYYFLHRKRILNSGIDLLYIHSPECCLPFLYNNPKIPVVYHQHGSANPVLLSKYTIGRLKFIKKIFDTISTIIYQRADWIIAIDPICMEQSAKSGAIKKTTLLKNAIDTNIFKFNIKNRIQTRTHLGLDEDKFSILYVGRLEKTKGVNRLLDCIPAFKSKKIRFHIFIVGDGSYMDSLHQYVNQNSYLDCVTFLNRIPHEDLPNYYNMADVLVLPSDMEGIPMVILESLSCGTPVVASNVGGIPSLIYQNINGILVNDVSFKSLSTAIIEVLRKEYNRKQISDTVSHLNSESFVNEFDRISSALIKK